MGTEPRLATLEKAIQSRGLTQKSLARILGKSPSTVSLYLSGRIDPPVSVCLKIAAIVGMPVEKLFAEAIFGGRHR